MAPALPDICPRAFLKRVGGFFIRAIRDTVSIMERETFIVVRIETPDGACLRRVRVSGSIDGEELARLVNEELQRAQKLPTRRDVVYSSA